MEKACSRAAHTGHDRCWWIKKSVLQGVEGLGSLQHGITTKETRFYVPGLEPEERTPVQ